MKTRLLSLLLAVLMLLSLTACGQSAPAVYEVRFELNGGSLVSGELLQRVEEGSAAEAPVIEREGYTFAGWNTAFDEVKENLVVVPRWEKLPDPTPVYEVRFELNGGTLVSGELLQRVEAGSAAALPEVERAGYAFTGWSQDVSAVDGNMLAVAQWAQIFRIVFDPAGGTVVSGELEQQVNRGETPVAPELELLYYAFAGWEPALGEATADASYTALWTPRKLSSEEVFAKASPAVVEIAADEPGDYYSLGTGFFIDDSGRFVTNYHVIDGTISGEITMQDGTVCPIVAVLDYDKALDLAILQADVTGNPYLRLSEKTVSTGETVYTLGSSEGLTSTFSTGIVSAASRSVEGVNCIQITAPISHGNSGGPLLDVYGEVVGINAMTYISGQNLNFAIDVHNLQNLRLSGSLSLQEVFDIEYPNGVVEDGDGDADFSSYADYYENESNDSYDLADILRNDTIVAASVSDVDDLDWFCFSVNEACEAELLVVPYYTDDMDYLMVGIFELNGNQTDIFYALEPMEEDGVQYLGGTVKLKKPGIYLVLVCLSDDYPYQSGADYLIGASW